MDAGMKKGFQLCRRGALPYLQAPLLAACRQVIHAFSTRLGGCSKGPMASLNMAFHTGDEYGCVVENRRRFLQQWGYRSGDIAASTQVHGVKIHQVRAGDRGSGALPDSFLGEGDALITTVPDLPLTGCAADCLLLFIVAPDVPAVALAHAGRQGTLRGMAPAVVAALAQSFGAVPTAMLAALGPGICGHCYTVSRALAREFNEAGWCGAPYLWEGGSGDFHLNLTAINMEQLRRAGIKDDRLAGSGWCTGCHPRLFYSYRRDGGSTGRMMGFIALRGDIAAAGEADEN